MAIARDVSSHVVYMNQGVICEVGTPEEVFGNPQRQETKDFLSRFRKNRKIHDKKPLASASGFLSFTFGNMP